MRFLYFKYFKALQPTDHSCSDETRTHETSSANVCVAPSPLYCKRNMAKISELSTGALPRRILQADISPNASANVTSHIIANGRLQSVDKRRSQEAKLTDHFGFCFLVKEHSRFYLFLRAFHNIVYYAGEQQMC